MIVDKNKCIGCGLCIPYCPAQAIHVEDKLAYIDLDLCFECGNCKHSDVCKKSALVQQTLMWPRRIRAVFSNVREKSPNTSLPGRGTEEMKTNDITGRFIPGKVGVACEIGRPATGTSMKDVETIARVVTSHGGMLEKLNPTALIFEDTNTGVVKQEFKNERALSVIIEALLDEDKLPELLADLKIAATKIDTVFSLDVISVMDNDIIPGDALIQKAGLNRRQNGKTCIGLGRPGK